MRITRLADAPVVVRIQHRDEVTVVLPASAPAYEILALARLVLSRDEFIELDNAMAHPSGVAAHHR